MSGPDPRDRLAGAGALVTGASSGIGRATALALAAEGADVGLAARSTDALEDLREAIEDEAGDETIEDGGGNALVIPTDVTDREGVESMVERAVEAFDGLDVLVNSAGVGFWDHEGIVDGDPAEWRTEAEVNLLGLMTATRAAAAEMVEAGGGDIVNVSSLSGRYPGPQHPGYVASKFGVRGFSESAMRDLRASGVRVTLVEPGEVATEMQPREAIESTTMLEPADVADAIVYAVSRPAHVCVNDIQLLPMARE